MTTLYENNPEAQLAAECARKKWETLKSLEGEKKKRRLVQYLQRRGFSGDIIYQSLKTLDIENSIGQTSSTLDQD
ncbi:MAG: RecX family transcriptional regulator [Nitrospinae bacterium]|nr:RecX family transcriptional regulator [Nitrospinota bacterium]